MNSKIARRLMLYFSAALLLFSLVIGIVFALLFQRNTVDAQKADLEQRAKKIAATLGELQSNGAATGMGMGAGKGGGYGAYLRFLDDIAMADVWIVDENLNLLTFGPMSHMQVNYADLPADAEQLVKQVFDGHTAFSEGFSGLLNTSTLTIGTPIVAESKIVGAVLLHTPVSGIQAATANGFKMLAISMAIALLLAVLLSGALAVSFTRPLKRMKETALQLADGDYSARTDVLQRDEIGELAHSLDQLSERLDEASKQSAKLEGLRRDFVANISHELRTPVTVLRGSLESLCDEVVTDPALVKRYYEQMLQESKHLQRLVDDLLDLSRLQNTDFAIDMQEFNLCDVLQDAARSAQRIAMQTASEKNLRVELKQDANFFPVKGDYGRLRQMLLIVLDNAIKFADPDSTVTISLNDKTVTISNFGPGIAPQDIPYLFDRFYKTHSEQNKNGTGLGLAIAKQIADRHEIVLHVKSEPHQTTEFSFQF